MTGPIDRLAEARALFGRMMAAASGSADPRIGQVFEILPREAFLPPGPGTCWSGSAMSRRQAPIPCISTATRWSRSIRSAASTMASRSSMRPGSEPLRRSPGETVIHIGAGGGYYTAMLSMLVEPGGKVFAYEIDARLAEMARRNLEPYGNVTLIHADAVTARLKRARHHLCQCRRGRPAGPLAEEPEARRPHDLPVATSAEDRACGACRTRPRPVLRCGSSAVPGSSPAAARPTGLSASRRRRRERQGRRGRSC